MGEGLVAFIERQDRDVAVADYSVDEWVDKGEPVAVVAEDHRDDDEKVGKYGQNPGQGFFRGRAVMQALYCWPEGGQKGYLQQDVGQALIPCYEPDESEDSGQYEDALLEAFERREFMLQQGIEKNHTHEHGHSDGDQPLVPGVGDLNKCDGIEYRNGDPDDPRCRVGRGGSRYHLI